MAEQVCVQVQLLWVKQIKLALNNILFVLNEPMTAGKFWVNASRTQPSYEELLHPSSEYVNGRRNSRIFDFAIGLL